MPDQSVVIEAARPSATLVPLRPFQALPGISLNRPLTLLGSGSMVHIRLRSHTISRIHAACLNTDGQVCIHDIASRTGLFVNGKRVRHAVLKAGDEVIIGKMGMRFSDVGEAAPLPAPVVPAQLFVQGNEKPHLLMDPILLVGRRESADLVLPGVRVSVAHALLFRIDGKWLVRDLGSRNGTKLNGQRIGQAELLTGDTLCIGHINIRFQAGTSASKQPEEEWPAARAAYESPRQEPIEIESATPSQSFEIELPEDALGPQEDVAADSSITNAAAVEPAREPAVEPAPEPAVEESVEPVPTPPSQPPTTVLDPAKPDEPEPPERFETLTATEATAPIETSAPPKTAQPPQPEPAETTIAPPVAPLIAPPPEPVAIEEPQAPAVEVAAKKSVTDPALLQNIHNWGPLAVAVASEMYPGLICRTQPPPAAPAPPKKKRHVWQTVVVSGLVLAAAATAAWFLYPKFL